MGRSLVENLLGIFVIAVAVGFVVFGVRTADVGDNGGYELSARFLKAGGLAPGSDVRISGVKVGSITSRTLDPVSFEAVVMMEIDPTIRIPVDTEAVITGEGLLGGKYLRLMPGREDAMLEAGTELTQTRDFRSLEDAVSEIIFLATNQ